MIYQARASAVILAFMTKGGDATLTALTALTVLAIACPPELVACCERALEGMGVGLRQCTFLNTRTAVAQRRPLVLLILDDVYAFDPEEFDALAKDVRASLVRVEEGISEAKLELLLTAAIDAAAARREQVASATSHTRRTAPNPAARGYRVGQRLPAADELAAAVWPDRHSTPPPSSRL
jgi:hypothetical protein